MGLRWRTRRFRGHALRASTGIAAQTLGFYALSVLPLAEQTALGCTQPLFVTILAIPFLGERVGIHRWSAVLLGFSGVLLIAAGQGVGFGTMPPVLLLGTAAGVAQGMFSAVTTMLVRATVLDREPHHHALAVAADGRLCGAVLLPIVWGDARLGRSWTC
ncbi:EamA family transporter [Dankookia sp. P2]|uniref:EamA family transporter n=1 Tax=Dankookia sp. P2 TaxID=3423955 RepID=UPI003D664FF9